MNVGKIESQFMKKKRAKIYIALEEIDFIWDTREIREFIQMWRKGFSVKYIADYFERPEIDCVLLVMDLSIKGRIKPRLNGLF
ncbi:hypothetical protein NG54_07840 [Heyndrickxia ginsengihumi]|uniref:Helix-turn-helix domain containing protein n=1 Tax=Heyndrickxia ginsengihumi TaxID=363870 RepID=A0A0A6VDY0_9BACI|nr:hypothetical protein NG54_07840 [Heyndrickxia ginsengihumi]